MLLAGTRISGQVSISNKESVKILEEDSYTGDEGDSILIIKNKKGNGLKKINKINARESNQKLCLVHQVRVMAAFYLIFVICNVLVQSLGNTLMKNGDEYICNDRNSIEPLKNSGAIFLFVQTILIFSFTCVVLMVYY